MANLTTTDLDNGKTDLETLSTVVNSQTESTTSTRLGDTVKTLKGLTDDFEQVIADGEIAFDNAIASAGYSIVGDFSDVTKVEITADSQVYTSKSISGFEDALWRTNQTLPYTPTGSDPTTGTELGKWVAVAQGELKGIARSLNVLDSEVIYSTDTTTVLDDVLYIYDASAQATWGKPSSVGVSETIVSVVGDAITTNSGSYTLESIYGKPIDVTKYGAVADGNKSTHTGTDSTQAFKDAITEARRYNTAIYVPPCPDGMGFILNDTLFFGPLDQSSIDTFPPNNVCLGVVGDNDESSVIICGDGLDGKVVLDYTGLGHKIAKDFTIWRETEAGAPSVGILTARFINGTGVTGNYGGHFKDVTMFKYFSIAPRLAITTEESREERLNLRTDHDDAFSCFVSTSDGSSEAYEDSGTSTSYSWNDLIGEVTESSLIREATAGSNLHQTHIKCDYYYGNNTPDPDKDPCMLRIDGANGMRIVDAFFNNNTEKFDAVQIRKAGTSGVPYGISVVNPLYHQDIKSGVRVMTGMARLNLSESNTLPGFGFDEAELVVDGFLTGATIEAVDSITQNETMDSCVISYVSNQLISYGPIINCDIEAVNQFTQGSSASGITNSDITCKTFDWNTDATIQTSEISVRDTLNALGSRGGTPKFNLRYSGTTYEIEGQIPGAWIGSPSSIDSESLSYKTSNLRKLDTLYNRTTDKPSQVIEHENSGFSGSMVEMNAPSGSTASFNYRKITRGGTTEITERKGGYTVYELTSGGVVLTDGSDGNKYRLVSTNGVLSLALFT